MRRLKRIALAFESAERATLAGGTNGVKMYSHSDERDFRLMVDFGAMLIPYKSVQGTLSLKAAN